ncbi:MAG: hypothetical protein E5299_00411 [Burkholderia gladioli]|nr:MAG: hypothetical protein E5299_00411 [Burkholderia gladioli]
MTLSNPTGKLREPCASDLVKRIRMSRLLWFSRRLDRRAACLPLLVLGQYRAELFIHVAHGTSDFFHWECLAVTNALLQVQQL